MVMEVCESICTNGCSLYSVVKSENRISQYGEQELKRYQPISFSEC